MLIEGGVHVGGANRSVKCEGKKDERRDVNINEWIVSLRYVEYDDMMLHVIIFVEFLTAIRWATFGQDVFLHERSLES